MPKVEAVDDAMVPWVRILEQILGWKSSARCSDCGEDPSDQEEGDAEDEDYDCGLAAAVAAETTPKDDTDDEDDEKTFNDCTRGSAACQRPRWANLQLAAAEPTPTDDEDEEAGTDEEDDEEKAAFAMERPSADVVAAEPAEPDAVEQDDDSEPEWEPTDETGPIQLVDCAVAKETLTRRTSAKVRIELAAQAYMAAVMDYWIAEVVESAMPKLNMDEFRAWENWGTAIVDQRAVAALQDCSDDEDAAVPKAAEQNAAAPLSKQQPVVTASGQPPAMEQAEPHVQEGFLTKDQALWNLENDEEIVSVMDSNDKYRAIRKRKQTDETARLLKGPRVRTKPSIEVDAQVGSEQQVPLQSEQQ